MKVLVTGGGGFLGKAIIYQFIERGYSVAMLGRSSQPELEKEGVEVFRGDIADKKAVIHAASGIDAIIHTAAKAGIWGSWESYYRPNVIGTQNVLEACRYHGIKKLVHTSSPSVVSQKHALCNADESTPYPKTFLCHYAKTKAMAEKLVLQANSRNLKTTAIRPHLIWGLGDPHIVPEIIKRAQNGSLRIIGRGLNKVDITHVDNAAYAHVLALDELERGNCAGKAYFISQGEAVVLWDWINKLLKRLELPLVKKKIPLQLAYGLGACLELAYKMVGAQKQPPCTRFSAVQLGQDHYFNITNARKDLGYEPRVTTKEGLDALEKDYKIKKSSTKEM